MWQLAQAPNITLPKKIKSPSRSPILSLRKKLPRCLRLSDSRPARPHFSQWTRNRSSLKMMAPSRGIAAVSGVSRSNRCPWQSCSTHSPNLPATYSCLQHSYAPYSRTGLVRWPAQFSPRPLLKKTLYSAASNLLASEFRMFTTLIAAACYAGRKRQRDQNTRTFAARHPHAIELAK